MQAYIKSWFPLRWLILVAFVLLTAPLVIQLTENLTTSIIISFLFWLLVDLMFGLGRKSALFNL